MASAFTIEKGVPLPRPNYGSGRTGSKYPWADMEVGDSFFAPLSAYACRGGTPTNSKYSITLSRIAANHTPKKFSVRQVDGGCRVWRIA